MPALFKKVDFCLRQHPLNFAVALGKVWRNHLILPAPGQQERNAKLIERLCKEGNLLLSTSDQSAGILINHFLPILSLAPLIKLPGIRRLRRLSLRHHAPGKLRTQVLGSIKAVRHHLFHQFRTFQRRIDC